MRYIVDDQYFKNTTSGNLRPIFFYCGNEGDIWDFYDNSGFMTTTLAKQFGALVVFGEHRYFGESFPFPKDIAFKEGYNSYLTVENTMMDYVELIKMIKAKYAAENQAVIAFGGSYGGMLAAWIRMKYPHVFQGALAASAPILQFQGGKGEYEFAEIATNDFATTYPNKTCSSGILEAFNVLMDLKTRPDDWPAVSELFNTCNPIDSADKLQNMYEHFMNGYLYMAMTDYPYASAFLNPMPAWPVNVSCEAFRDIAPQTWEKETYPRGVGALSPREVLILTALNTSSNVYFNY